MDKIQEVLLDLIKRIDETCKQNSLTYYLGNETALCAARWGHFADNCSGASILMPADDYDKFEQITISHPEEHTVESKRTNPDFPFPFLHYVDKDTTRINLSLIGLQEHPGIAVKVIKLVRYTPGKCKELLRDKMAFAAVDAEDAFSVIAKYPNNYDMSRLERMRNDKDYAFSLYESGLTFEGAKNDMYYLQQYRNTKKTVEYSAFEGEPSFVKLEGISFPVPSNYKHYLSVIYGRRWQSREITFEPYSSNFVVDTENPYSCYMPVISQLLDEAEDYRRVKHEKIPLQIRTNEAKSDLDKEHYFFERTVDRINCAEKYLPEKDRLISLYKKGRFFELFVALEEYQIIAEKHAHRSIPFAFDKDLYTILCDLLLWQEATTEQKYLIKTKKEAFSYLDENAPNNEQKLKGSMYKYIKKDRCLRKKSRFRFLRRTIAQISAEELENRKNEI